MSQCSDFIKKNKLVENVRADTAGSAKFVSEIKDKSKAAISSNLSAKIYNLDVLDSNIQDDKENVTRFLLMQKDIVQPDFEKHRYITSLIFKLKSLTVLLEMLLPPDLSGVISLFSICTVVAGGSVFSISAMMQFLSLSMPALPKAAV